MSSINGTGSNNNQDVLNRSMPAAHQARLGDCINDLITQHNDLVSKYNALLAHLDTANVAGIGNGNVAAYGETTVITPLNQRGS